MSQREDNGQSYDARYEQQRGYGGSDEHRAQGPWDERHPQWNDRPGSRDQSWREPQQGFAQRSHWREPFQYRSEQPGRSRYREGTSAGNFPRDQYEQRYGHEHSSSEEMFGRRAFGPPEDTHYYGTGAAGWGGPGFTGGAYAYGNGPRDQERPLDAEYSDESAVSYRPRYARNPYPHGPKGYQRSDERLKEDISERLMESRQIDCSDVSLEVRGGKVSLEGSVPRRYMKHAIEDLVDACPGVQDIDNRVRVASALTRPMSQSQSDGGASSLQSSGAGTSGSSTNMPSGTRSKQ